MAETTEILEKLTGRKRQPTGVLDELRTSTKNITDKLLEIDPGADFDKSGIRKFGFRAALSRMDTPEEREAFLERSVGKDGFTQDKFGRIALTPIGKQRLGIDPGEKPTLIDEPAITLTDVADFANLAPAIAGATGAGVLAGTGGLGTVPAMGLIALGGMGGKALDELAESFQGLQRQGPGEIAGDIALEGVETLGGEALGRGLMMGGRRLLRPTSTRGLERAREAAPIAEDLRAIGAKATIPQMTESPLLGRQRQLATFIFGDPVAVKNAQAFNNRMAELRRAAGPVLKSGQDLGEQIVADVRNARKGLSNFSEIVYGRITQLAEARGIRVSTQRLKAKADEVLETLGVLTEEGERVFADPALVSTLENIGKLPSEVSISQMQQTSNRLFEAIADEGIVPGITGRNASLLFRASRETFKDVGDPEIRRFLASANNEYRKRIIAFRNNLFQRITKEPGAAGAIDPEVIVDTVFKKGRTSGLRRLMAGVTESTRKKIRRAAMGDLLEKLVKETDDPVTTVFDGKAFIVNLNSFGKETLEAMFGKELTGDMFRFGRAVQLATKKFGQAGKLAAAGIAMRPIANLKRLVQLNMMARFLDSDIGFKTFTQGFEAKTLREAGDVMNRIGTQFAARLPTERPTRLEPQVGQ